MSAGIYPPLRNAVPAATVRIENVPHQPIHYPPPAEDPETTPPQPPSPSTDSSSESEGPLLPTSPNPSSSDTKSKDKEWRYYRSSHFQASDDLTEQHPEPFPTKRSSSPSDSGTSSAASAPPARKKSRKPQGQTEKSTSLPPVKCAGSSSVLLDKKPSSNSDWSEESDNECPVTIV